MIQEQDIVVFQGRGDERLALGQSISHPDSEKMEVTSALTGDKIRIDPRKVNTMAISYHKRNLGFVRMDDGKAWIVKESLAELAAIYSDAINEA